jgi:hypothetical protein
MHTALLPPPHYRIADERLKDACGAAAAAGLRPVLDPLARSPQMAATGKQATPGSWPSRPRAHSACPDTSQSRKERAQTPVDTGPLLQG